MISVPDLSIIIVSFQVRRLLDRCLASIRNNKSSFSIEVLVVDNASSDGTAAWVKENYPEDCLIANSTNRGYSAANNQGLKAASGRYLMLLNPDTLVPDSRPLDTLLRFMDSHPRAGACGPSLRYTDGSFQHAAFRFPSITQVYFDLFPPNWRVMESRFNGRYSRKVYAAGRPFLVDHPLGAAFMVRRGAIEQVGWLDEGFYIYSEEIDWAKRIRKAGWQIWCVPEAEIIHLEAQSTRQFREQMLVELWRSRFRYFHKHEGPVSNKVVGLVVRAGMRRAARRARHARSMGEISESQLKNQLDAYASVGQMANASG